MEGRVVWANRYAVFDEIASGGMATVFLAGRLGQVNGLRVVAVKKLFEQFAKEPDFVAMFLDEARLAARIRHPNVIKTYQVIRVPDSLAIVMELVIGVSFVELLRGSRTVGESGRVPLPLPLAGAVVVGTLRGLHAAHEAFDETGTPFGLVHRDVSPHNILVGKDGAPRVIDFGIAKAAGRLQNTEAGVTKGKFAYMAPEQLRGAAVDRRTDVYAAGVVLWEALTGRRLFNAASDLANIAKRAAGDHVATAPSQHNEGLSKAVDDVILRALRVDPAERYATAEEMARAVEGVIGVAPVETVAAWVKSSADGKLRELEAKVSIVEEAIDEGQLDELTQVVGEVSVRSGPPSLVIEVPELELRPPVARAVAAAPPASRRSFAVPAELNVGTGPSLDLDVASAVPTPPSRPTAPPRSSGGPRLSVPPASGPPRQASRPSLPSRSTIDAPRANPSRGRAWPAVSSFATKSGSLVLAALVLAVGTKVGTPILVRSLAARAAEQRGFTLSSERATIGLGEVTLEDTSLVLARGACTLRVDAAEMHVALDGWASAEKLTIPAFRMTVTGNVKEVGQCVAAWAREPHPSTEISASAGHLVWPDALAPGVALEAEGFVVTLAKVDVIDLHVVAKELVTKVDAVRLGPWPARLDVTPEESKLVVSLDATNPGAAPSATVVARPDLGTLFSVAIPRTSPVSLGLPPTFLHVGPAGELSVTLEGQVFPTGTPVNARGKIALYGVALPSFGAASKGDIVVDGEISGPANEPIKIDKGKLEVHGVTTPLNGFVGLETGSIRVQLDRPPTSKGAAREPIVIDIDSRSWTQGDTPHTPPSSPAAATAASASVSRSR